MYTLFQTLWGVVISATLNGFTAYGTSWRPKRCSRVFFSSRSMSTATHVTLQVASQTKQTEYTPCLFQTKMAKSIPYVRLEMLENGTLWGGTYLYGLHMGVPPPPPRGSHLILPHTLRTHYIMRLCAPPSVMIFFSQIAEWCFPAHVYNWKRKRDDCDRITAACRPSLRIWGATQRPTASQAARSLNSPIEAATFSKPHVFEVYVILCIYKIM